MYLKFKDPETGEAYGSVEVWRAPKGWFWAAGFPGCLWDGDPVGPFTTEGEAIEDAGAEEQS